MTPSNWFSTLIFLTLSIETLAWPGNPLAERKAQRQPRDEGDHYRLHLPPRAEETTAETMYQLPWSYGYNPPPPSPASTLSAFLNSTGSSVESTSSPDELLCKSRLPTLSLMPQPGFVLMQI
ncbi:hypothetical protein MN608_08723 [Microdochium nivale]|nr:hypothetical protein MN608_08723 [Microdochium nivale]